MLKSDLIFMTKTGLEQFEEVLLSRHLNHYRNKKVPRLESLPYEKYLGPTKKAKSTPWSTIIKPTLDQSADLVGQDLTILTPSIK